MAFVCARVGLGHKDFHGYRGKLRTIRVLWRLQGLAEDVEYGFRVHWRRIRTQRVWWLHGFSGWQRTSKVAFVAAEVGLVHKDCCDAFTALCGFRYQMFRVKKGDIVSGHIPPC